MRSMTGFGAGSAEIAGGTLFLEIRSLNNKHQDVRLRLPGELSDHGFYLEQTARSELGRGRYEVSVRLVGFGLEKSALDKEKLRHHFATLTELRDELAPKTEIRMGDVLRLDDIYCTEGADHGSVRAALQKSFQEAKESLTRMRADEGAHLKAEIEKRLELILSLKEQIESACVEQVEHHRQKLRERVAALLSDPEILSEQRLEQELAFLADKSDITEELVRLKSHVTQLEGMICEDAPVGRRLDFLLQEMSREVNTVGSKSQHAKIAYLVVEMKSEVERLREQVQNIE